MYMYIDTGVVGMCIHIYVPVKGVSKYLNTKEKHVKYYEETLRNCAI